MQAFLSARAELAAESSPPAEALEALSAKGFPKIKTFTKLSAPNCDGSEIFFLNFASADDRLGSKGTDGASRAVLHVLGDELGTGPLFTAAQPDKAVVIEQALQTASASGARAPKLLCSGELARRGALRRVRWVLLESCEGLVSSTVRSSSAASSVKLGGAAVSWSGPRYGDVAELLAELQRLTAAAGATELVAPLERLVATCRDTPAVMQAAPPCLLLPRGDGAADAVELEASGGSFGGAAPWGAAALGDPRLLESEGEPWDLLRAFSHVVKARWLIDLLRRAPGTAPKCELSLILRAHDDAQAELARRGWLPATIVAPGSSSAKLSETFPEEICPSY